MTRIFFRHAIAILLALAAWAPGAGAAPAEPLAPGPQYVQVQSASVKAQPVGFSRTVAFLKQGDEVTVTSAEETAGYVPVRVGEKSGYILRSVLVTKERYKEIEKESVASAQQVGAQTATYGAAKGLSEGAVNEYSKQKNLDAELAVVKNKIMPGPYANVPPADIEKDLQQFMAQGKLGGSAATP